MVTQAGVAAAPLEPLQQSIPTQAITLKQPTWSSLIQDPTGKICSFKPTFETTNGTATVDLPSEILEDAVPLWKHFILGHFIAEPPHIGKVHAIVNKIWSFPGSRIDVQFISKTAVLFRITDDAMRARVLKRYHWHIAAIPMVVHEWRPETATETPDLTSIPLWVDFGAVPGELFSHKGLSFLASVVGTPLKLHPKTERCTRLDVARMLIEVDLQKPLPAKINARRLSGDIVTVTVSYPWLPPRCSCCNKWGHETSACDATKKVSHSEQKFSNDGESIQYTKKTETKNIASTSNLKTKIPSNISVEVITTNPEIFKPDTSERAWTKVEKSPRTKNVETSKSQTVLENRKSTQALITGKISTSPSRFSVLADIEEGEMIEVTETNDLECRIPTIPEVQEHSSETLSSEDLSQTTLEVEADSKAALASDIQSLNAEEPIKHRKRSKQNKPILSRREQGGQNPKKASTRKQ